MRNIAIKKKINVRNEAFRIRNDPLRGFLEQAYFASGPGGERDRYEYAYYLYKSAMIRAFEQISALARYNAMREQGNGIRTPGRKRVAEKARSLRPYFALDMSTALIQTRILLDRVIALSRVFLVGAKLPSFTSFADHKKFLVRNSKLLAKHLEYANYIATETDWFETEVKFVRDKFIVHHGPKHFFLYTSDPDYRCNVYLNILALPTRSGQAMQHYKVNIWQLSYNIEYFLKWFAQYAAKAYAAKS